MKPDNIFTCIYILISFLLIPVDIFSEETESCVLFSIGRKDGSSSEFALYPDGYKNFMQKFGGEKTYLAGYSEDKEEWPYVIPGPVDSWGGGGFWSGFNPRHSQMIWFNISKPECDGLCRLDLSFVGASDKSETEMRIEINGHRSSHVFHGNSTEALLVGNEAPAPYMISVDFPLSYLSEGLNSVRLTVVKGHWCIFDCIRMSTPAGVVLIDSGPVLIRSVKTADFEYSKGSKHYQPVHVDMLQLSDSSRTLTFITDGIEAPVCRVIEPGESIQEILVPAVKSETRQTFMISDGDKVIYSGEIVRNHHIEHRFTDYVDLFMGTGNSRWMFKPSQSLPLSMVQIAPDNQNETWKAGYEYTIENISGFNHFCDWTMAGFLMQPTHGELHVSPGPEDEPDKGYRSRIDKARETANIGKYSVYMTDTDILAEITATRRAAIQRYTFPSCEDARIMVDLFAPNEYPHNLTDAVIVKEDDDEISGYARYHNSFTGYTLEQEYTVYFVLQFSKPFKSMNGWINDIEPVTGYIDNWNRKHEFAQEPDIYYDINKIEGHGDVGVFLEFDTAEDEKILVRSGVSLVDIDGARNNLEKELSGPFGWDFEKVEKNAIETWNRYLGRVEIESDDYLQKKKFYTNLYRALSAKAIWSDADGRFVDESENICKLDAPEDCIVSGEYWNTFWNIQPLFNLVAPEISSLWARSAVSLYRNSGWFNTDPAGIEHTGVMVAMHCISQLLSAWRSGIRDFDLSIAYEGLKKAMLSPPEKYAGGGTVGVEHLVPYMEYGYVPMGLGLVSNTMEYSYDDWCLGQMAEILGYDSDRDYFIRRSESWKNLFDPVSGFLRPKDEDGRWVEPFDPYHTPGFTEGNAFNYTWFVPHDPEGLIELVGKDRFVNRLDSAMAKSAIADFNATGDDFANFPVNHGNETSMEVAYLFNWAGRPDLTQKWVRAIQEQYYGTTPFDAYPGDEDLGQMSGWYVMSAIGLFQMAGGCEPEPFYELGSPRFSKVTIHLDGRYGRGKDFTIVSKKASKSNKYIRSAYLNGKPVQGFKIMQSDVLKGGTLELEMSDIPAEY